MKSPWREFNFQPVAALHLWNRSANKRFQRNRFDVKAVQARILNHYLNLSRGTTIARHMQLDAIGSWRDLKKLPTTTFSDWAQWIEKARENQGSHLISRSPIERFQPSSGSTHERKWIPYTKKFLNELDEASASWLYDLGQNHPGILKGRHYWSLSWLPDDLRKLSSNDDLDLWPWWKQKLMGSVMVAPGQVANLPTNKHARFATATLLASAADLALLSVWSPVFLLRILDDLVEWRDQIVDVLETSRWPDPNFKNISITSNDRQISVLKNWNRTIMPDFLRELWPQLALVSAWDSSTSASFADKIKKLFSACSFQGKGLWATEGVVTIPIEGKNVLAFQSHFFEFRCLDTGKIRFAWEIEPGQRVQPILTTGSGIWRYELPDEMLVCEIDRGLPVLEFRGRIGSIDLVGEKMDYVWASQVLQEISSKFKLTGLTFLAEKTENLGGYTLLAQGPASDTKEIENWVENRLADQLHYKLARQMGQLRPVQVRVSENALNLYSKITMKTVGVEGARKIESVTFLGNS